MVGTCPIKTACSPSNVLAIILGNTAKESLQEIRTASMRARDAVMIQSLFQLCMVHET